MEGTELAPAEFADSGSNSYVVSFNSHTLKLINSIIQLDIKWQSLGINQYSLKWQDLVNMLKGSWAVLESTDNPEMQAHAAHSMRELIEKACYLIGQVPDKVQGSDGSEDDKKRTPTRLLVEFFISNDGSTSEHIIESQTDALWKLREDFVEISHHSSEQKTIDVEEMKQKITEMEEILLNLFCPQSIKDLDELDALMAQGESL